MKFGRQQKLYGALAVTIALVAWTAWNDSDTGIDADNGRVGAQPRVANPAFAKPSNGTQAKGSLAPNRDPLVEARTDPFAVVSFVPPAPVVAVAPPPPPPKPTAPPFPYRFFGSMTDIDGKKTVYLQHGDELIPIQNKQILNTNYRIESIDDKQIVISYLPLEEQTVLTIQTAENQ